MNTYFFLNLSSKIFFLLCWAAYDRRIECIKTQIADLDKQTLALKESASSLGKQYIINKDTITRYSTLALISKKH